MSKPHPNVLRLAAMKMEADGDINAKSKSRKAIDFTH